MQELKLPTQSLGSEMILEAEVDYKMLNQNNLSNLDLSQVAKVKQSGNKMKSKLLLFSLKLRSNDLVNKILNQKNKLHPESPPSPNYASN